MEANKNGGTGVGFTQKESTIIRGQIIVYEGETLEDAHKRVKECKHKYDNFCRCKFCGSKMTKEEMIEEQRLILGDPNWKRDFKIPENLEQINKQQWEDIWDEFKKTDIFSMRGNFFYLELLIWLKENYLAPEKK